MAHLHELNRAGKRGGDPDDMIPRRADPAKCQPPWEHATS
jgi:hypothetical protein